MSPLKPRRTQPSVPAKTLAPQSADAAGREPRGARRKRETREKLIDAAFRLMAERGMDAVAINQITEEADVGFGSFYNHFESKEAIYDAVNERVFEGFADALDRLVKDVEDPAEVISICVRHSILRARREPLWGRVLVREGLSSQSLSRGLGARLLRDIQKGVAKGRFKLFDPLVSFMFTGAGVLGAIATEIEMGTAPRKPPVDAANLPERAAAVVLHHLGVPEKEARQVSQRPLPVVDAPAPSP